MSKLRFFSLPAAVLSLILLVLPGAVQAQPAGTLNAQTPMTRELGALITRTANTGAGTINSANQSGFNVARVQCVYNITVVSGTVSNTFKIQGYDGASQQYYDMITSAAISSTTTNVIAAGADLTNTANVTTSTYMIPRIWRVVIVAATGSSPQWTGTVGCNVQ